MKYLYTLFMICLTTFGADAQTSNPKYDAALAQKLKADDYGMKAYVLVILKTGSNTTADKKVTDSCFKGHMANIEHMVETGKLCVAGPLQKNDKTYRGIFILSVASIEEARELLKNDPAVTSNILEPEFYNWYGSAALPEYLEASDRVWKKKH